jgi:arylsulfatase
MSPEIDCVVLITIDSLRRDYVGCYSYSSLTHTPTIDALASKGLLFTNAISHGGGTPEAFPSILCSIPPPYELKDRNVWKNKTLAQYLKESGFMTAAFHSNPYLTKIFGYHKGFDFFFQGDVNVYNSWFTAINVLRNRAPITNAKQLTTKCIKWIKEAKKPFFIWIHYMDAHFPYLPPTYISGIMLSLKGRMLWPFLMGMKIQHKYFKRPPRFKKTLIKLYSKSITSIDIEINHLLRGLQKYSKNPLIVLTSDHGDAFWEHHTFGHSSVYDEIIKVPLIIYTKNLKGKIENQVGHSGILPTILELLEIDYDRKFYSPSLLSMCEDYPVISVSLDAPFGRRVISYRAPSWKYIRKEKLNGELIDEELYLLNEDPLEKINQINFKRDLANEADEVLNKTWIQTTHPVRKVFSKKVRQKIMKRLKAFRYFS